MQEKSFQRHCRKSKHLGTCHSLQRLDWFSFKTTMISNRILVFVLPFLWSLQLPYTWSNSEDTCNHYVMLCAVDE
ncbi:hypothetical protein KP509_17G029800 [Ceratopteris richardii]|uniref:Uncharacterized protein n=1 Tax=Ceratopteris richardii TaxID=49495 RepID=A0A8T2ST35_CERRI|nr:hypothetical protein KP509_17G029800 [Ceratopteris richardii]